MYSKLPYLFRWLMHYLYSINNLLTTSFHKKDYLLQKNNDRFSAVLFRAEVNEKEKLKSQS
jgi:hypothetical protein